MTTLELIAYYVDLIILQYKEKPKARGTVDFLVSMPIANQIYTATQNAFDLETAVGVQLDTLGKYVGASRNGYGFTGPITLGDSDYRQLLRFKIITNNAGSSLAEIEALLNQYFYPNIIISDYTTMRISYLLDTAIGSFDLAQVLVTGGYLPKPMAVQLSTIVFSPTIRDFFGFRTYDYATTGLNSPFNSYDDYQMDEPWLTYDAGLFA